MPFWKPYERPGSSPFKMTDFTKNYAFCGFVFTNERFYKDFSDIHFHEYTWVKQIFLIFLDIRKDINKIFIHLNFYDLHIFLLQKSDIRDNIIKKFYKHFS